MLKIWQFQRTAIEITFKVTGLKAALNDLKEGTYKDPETGENVKNDTITKDDIDASEGALPTPSEQPTVKPSEKPNVTPAPTTARHLLRHLLRHQRHLRRVIRLRAARLFTR